MIQIRKSEDRGQLKLKWLFARYTFSFANYYDPEFTGFGDLLVLNHDIVSPAGGFAPHPHNDMEIVTYVIRGKLEHKDSMGHIEQISAGEVQRMSAGTGVTHSEYNASDKDEVELLQIWILPNALDLKPSYEQKKLNDFQIVNGERILVSQEGMAGSLKINQNVKFFSIEIPAGEAWTRELNNNLKYWLQIVRGSGVIDEQNVKAGDGLSFQAESTLDIHPKEKMECLLIELR